MKKSKILGCCILTLLISVLLPVCAKADMATEPAKIFWDGFNPFQQPFATTYYYGSGDVNLDTVVNAGDILAVQEIINGTRTPKIMADVNGDGIINGADLVLLNNAVNNGGILPGWWNSLTTREARVDWVMKMMAIDKTSERPGASNYTCVQFAGQTAIDFAYSRWNTDCNYASGSQTVFNLPMYDSTNHATNWGHSINAILVGENPLNFDDWLFVEPQHDWTVRPGDWSMPDGAYVIISSFKDQNEGAFSVKCILEFTAKSTGSTLKYRSTKLILSRPPVITSPVINPTDCWNPSILKKGGGYLVFDQMREDMSRTTDIHITSMPYTASNTTLSITKSDFASRLIDSCVAPDGTTHIIWNGTYIEPGVDIKDGKMHTGIYYGILNPATGTISNKTWIADSNNSIAKGRVLYAPNGVIHVLVNDFRSKSINWYTKSGGSWSSMTKVVENITYDNSSSWIPHAKDPKKYFFDAAVTENSEVILSFIGSNSTNNTKAVYCKKYSPATNTWGTADVIYNGTSTYIPCGLSSAWDGNNIQLAFWDKKSSPSSNSAERYRGNVYVMSLSGSTWSSPVCLDNSGQSTSTRIISDGKGKSCLVWDRRIDTMSKPIYSIKNSEGNWGSPVQLAVRAGAEAFYPDAAYTENNCLYICWSSRSEETIEIETYKVPSYNSSDPANYQTRPPVLYYDFDKGQALDMSGNNNNGTLCGSPLPASTAGRKNQGLNFASGAFINAANSSSLNFGTGDFSISCWVKTTAAYAKLVNKKGSSGVGFSLEIFDGVPLIQVNDPQRGFCNYYNFSMDRIDNDVWHFITVVMDRDSTSGARIYVDGVLKSSQNALYRTGDLSNTGILSIGKDGIGGSRCYIGALDELRIYNRVLLDSEIQTLYSDYYNMIKLSFDGNLTDISGNGNSIDSPCAIFTNGTKNMGLDANVCDTLTIAHNPTLNLGTNDFSIAFWMKRDAFTGLEPILDKMDITTSKGYIVEICNRSILLELGNFVYVFDGNLVMNSFNNQWHHIVITADRDMGAYGIKLYVDGVRVRYDSSSLVAAVDVSNTQALKIGRFHHIVQQYKGSLDELCIYGRVFTPAEITAMYNEGHQ